ncbi:hypothetical protein AZI86_11880 [Bdellovibrio bacteriovorus]|uniref:Lipoprotein n=1 Tax=Bdellovibrio bacteriovorus TaxID=959 RepID=A0A150WLX6_BDEBC|nr:hypothetical protein [Bdellovibrio bacteriovorus]KYG64892.1 hypothetical protein AZI86_11880 [Bdellovibrio bacteriovorus]
MKSVVVGVLLCVTVSGCTVYRSEGRKQFESEAPTKLKTSALVETSAQPFELVSCKKETRLETWLNEEFPAATYEMVVVEQDLEIWRTFRGKTVEVKALQRSQNATTSCIYRFSSDKIWNLYKNQFVKELENNLMTLD